MKISNRQLCFTHKSLAVCQIKSLIFSRLQIVGQLFVRFFASGDQLQVWTKKDRRGRISWHAYDPVNGAKVSRDTEVEMREWIERRYYKS